MNNSEPEIDIDVELPKKRTKPNYWNKDDAVLLTELRNVLGPEAQSGRFAEARRIVLKHKPDLKSKPSTVNNSILRPELQFQ